MKTKKKKRQDRNEPLSACSEGSMEYFNNPPASKKYLTYKKKKMKKNRVKETNVDEIESKLEKMNKKCSSISKDRLDWKHEKCMEILKKKFGIDENELEDDEDVELVEEYETINVRNVSEDSMDLIKCQKVDEDGDKEDVNIYIEDEVIENEELVQEEEEEEEDEEDTDTEMEERDDIMQSWDSNSKSDKDELVDKEIQASTDRTTKMNRDENDGSWMDETEESDEVNEEDTDKEESVNEDVVEEAEEGYSSNVLRDILESKEECLNGDAELMAVDDVEEGINKDEEGVGEEKERGRLKEDEKKQDVNDTEQDENESKEKENMLEKRIKMLEETILHLSAELEEAKRAVELERKSIKLPGHVCSMAEPCTVAAQLEERLLAKREAAAATYRTSLQEVEKMVSQEITRLEEEMSKLKPLNKLAADWEMPNDQKMRSIMYRHDYMLVTSDWAQKVPQNLKSFIGTGLNELNNIITEI